MAAAVASALDSSTLAVESKPLNTPPLPEVVKVLQDGLKQNFSEVSVKVVECPDLTQKPWGLAAKGKKLSTKIIENKLNFLAFLFSNLSSNDFLKYFMCQD